MTEFSKHKGGHMDKLMIICQDLNLCLGYDKDFELKLFYDNKIYKEFIKFKTTNNRKIYSNHFCNFTPIKNRFYNISKNEFYPADEHFCTKEIVELNSVNLLSLNLRNFMRFSCLLVHSIYFLKLILKFQFVITHSYYVCLLELL